MLTHITTKAELFYKSQKRGQRPRFFYATKKSFVTPIKNIITLIRIGKNSAGILHDIMSPITALLCSLSLIDESHPNANIILDSKHNTEKIMQFMRDQIDGNDSETLFSLSETVLMILRIMQHKAAKNSVTIKHISHGTKNFVFTKRTIISRILMNLISNSIDAFDTCKSENKNVYVETYTTNASIIISIRDNGCGMSNKQQKSIFKYFYTSKETGIGLGLPTVKRMVCYNLKGKIDCVSEINTGTTFTVTIPLS